jgi:hypothetical protein
MDRVHMGCACHHRRAITTARQPFARLQCRGPAVAAHIMVASVLAAAAGGLEALLKTAAAEIVPAGWQVAPAAPPTQSSESREER